MTGSSRSWFGMLVRCRHALCRSFEHHAAARTTAAAAFATHDNARAYLLRKSHGPRVGQPVWRGAVSALENARCLRDCFRHPFAHAF